MKIELTARDKKLLTFLGVFVIVVLIGYYGIIPQIKKASELDDDIEEQQSIRTVNETKIGQLIMVEANNEELEKLIDGAKDNYYPMMDNDAIDKLVTNTVMDKYGLISYDLNIGEKSLASIQPYIYSNKALTGESDARERAMQAAAPIISEDGMLLFADISESEEASGDATDEEYSNDAMSSFAGAATNGVYMVPIQMRLSGDMENIIKFLDDLALSEKKVRLVNYSIDTDEIHIPHEDGTEEIYVTDSLNVSAELYMCAE